MVRSVVEGRAGRWWTDRVAVAAIISGGLLMTVLYLPFTLAHGPTSFNEERLVLGSDMHRWGMLLGVVPNLLIGGGLWRLRERIASGRGATAVLAIAAVALLLDALVNLVLGGLGAPFVLFILGPATLTLAALIRAGGAGRTRLRLLFAALGTSLTLGVGLALIPQEVSDAFHGYRAYGFVVHGIGGLLWALIGVALRSPDLSPAVGPATR